jgi:hypothetical protein
MSEYQEEVLTNLLDLQAGLRGDEPEPHDVAEPDPVSGMSADEGSPSPGETVAVIEEGLTVSVDAAPIDEWGVNDRIAAMNDRLTRLEYHLAGVTKRIERIEPERVMEPSGGAQLDGDARSRAFTDLQKIVADRLDRR